MRLIADVDRSAENHCMLTWANGTRASDRPVAGGGSRSRTHSEGRAGHLHLVAGDGAAALRRAAHRRSQRSPWRSRRQDRRGEQVHWCPQEPNQTECRRKIEHSPDAPTWSARPRPPGRPVRPGGRARCAAPPKPPSTVRATRKDRGRHCTGATRRDRSIPSLTQRHNVGPTHQTHPTGVADMLKLATVEQPPHLSRSQLQDWGSLGGGDPVRVRIVQVASPRVRPLRYGFRLTRSNRSAVKQFDRLLATAPEDVNGVELPSWPRRAGLRRAADDLDVDASWVFVLRTPTSRRGPLR